jgi:hypothetical protein
MCCQQRQQKLPTDIPCSWLNSILTFGASSEEPENSNIQKNELFRDADFPVILPDLSGCQRNYS